MSNDKNSSREKLSSGAASGGDSAGSDPSLLSPTSQPGGAKPKRLRMGIIILVIVLILALVGGGYSIFRHFNESKPVVTSQNRPVIVTPTATPLFRDTFQNNAVQWDMNQPAGARITLANNGKLILETENHTIFTEPLPGRTTLGNFRLDVDAGLTGGDPHNSYGVLIRISTGPTNPVSLYYRFEVSGDGSFAIFRGSVNGDGSLRVTLLKESLQPSKAVAHAGSSPNHLTIIAQGSALTFIVNGTTLADFIDGGYSSGYTALFVSQAKDASTPAQATFQNLALFSV